MPCRQPRQGCYPGTYTLNGTLHWQSADSALLALLLAALQHSYACCCLQAGAACSADDVAASRQGLLAQTMAARACARTHAHTHVVCFPQAVR
jgi:hypothetical protein